MAPQEPRRPDDKFAAGIQLSTRLIASESSYYQLLFRDFISPQRLKQAVSIAQQNQLTQSEGFSQWKDRSGRNQFLIIFFFPLDMVSLLQVNKTLIFPF